MKKLLCIVLLLLAHINLFAQREGLQMPSLSYYDDGEKSALRLTELHINVKVVGNLATTTMDMLFYNDTKMTLEGELNFPLAEGQQICHFAMELNGKLRDAVVVEKAEGRKVFEEITRRKIDPALLEQTKGNSFRTRVYPILGQQTKRVVIAYENEMLLDDDGMTYNLPLQYKDELEKFSLKVQVFTPQKPDLKNSEFQDLNFEQDENYFAAEVHYEDYLADKNFEFFLPNSVFEKQIYTELISGKTYFYINLQPKIIEQERVLPSKICLLWDVSTSAQGRDFEKETALLDEYFKKIKNCIVELVPFSNDVEKSTIFTIINGDWKQLKEKLGAFLYDGGTQLGALDLSKYSCDEFLLSTDGINNFGEKEIKFSNKPVYIISSNQTADHSYLKYLAQKTGGVYINLLNTTEINAISGLLKANYSFISAEYSGNEISETYPTIPTPVKNYFSISGMLLKSNAEIKLNFGISGKILHTETIQIDKKQQNSNTGMLSRIWATKKLAELDMLSEKNKEAITALGKEFSLITKYTSLIVLDRIEDYVRYKIVPPDELKEEYFARIKNIDAKKVNEDSIQLSKVNRRYADLKEWLKKEFKQNSKIEKDSIPWEIVEISSSVGTPVPIPDSEIVDSNPLSPGELTSVAREGIKSISGSSSGRVSNPLVPSFPDEETQIRVDGLDVGNQYTGSASAIGLKKWEANAPYIKKLKDEEANELYPTYIKLKKDNGKTTGFYLDCADFFAEKEQKETALKILSNIAELEMENHQIMRILAYRLMQLKYYNLAVILFREVLKIREEEPQSYRDLALALELQGNVQEAADLLYSLITKKWDSRFPDIELIALNEFNHILSKNIGKINLEKYDKKFIAELPVDIRIVLNWDADNSDMDLWVIEPTGEKCYYSHPSTKIGGRLSRDLTGGYGPEEYMVKKALPGKYQIKVNYYGSRQQKMAGPTTVMLQIFTNYGRPNETKQEITLRLSDIKEVVEVGEVEFK